MKIAVLTSGGDAPGMNAAVRAVARITFARHWEAAGIEAGYRGLLEGRFHSLGNRGVGDILQQGGTVLGTARPCPHSRASSANEPATRNLRRADSA